MALFSGFNNLADTINAGFGKINSVTNTISRVNNSLSRIASGNVFKSVNNFVEGISNTVNTARSFSNSIDNLLNGSGGDIARFGSNLRMTGNAVQGVTPGAAPRSPSRAIAQVINSPSNSADPSAGDWRVSLSVPTEIGGGAVLGALGGGRMIFPFTPTVYISHTANYNQITPTHTNYAFHAYQNSQIDNITIGCDFYVENESDAKYWVACVHFLRTMTKMFYGEGYGDGGNGGNPPPVSRLNGYGKHVFNNIPVLITNFTVDLQNSVDYIPCIVGNETNYVPTHSTITVTCAPNYARTSHARFNLKKFANGDFVGQADGFV